MSTSSDAVEEMAVPSARTCPPLPSIPWLPAARSQKKKILVFGSLTSVASVPVTEACASVTLTEARTEGTTEVQLYLF
jgi:hypothetical protein